MIILCLAQGNFCVFSGKCGLKLDAESGMGYFKEDRCSGSFQKRVWIESGRSAWWDLGLQYSLTFLNYSCDKGKRNVQEQASPLSGTMPDVTVSHVLELKCSIPP